VALSATEYRNHFCVVPELPSDQHGCTIADATALPNSARPRAD
jgi:hypothetical protein